MKTIWRVLRVSLGWLSRLFMGFIKLPKRGWLSYARWAERHRGGIPAIQLLSSVAFAVMSVIVSSLAINLAREQNLLVERQVQLADEQGELANRQLALAEAQIKPKIRLRYRSECKSGEVCPFGDYDCVEFWNDSGPLEGLNVMQHSFLLVSRNDRPNEEVRYVPMYYLQSRQLTGAGRGLLGTFCAFMKEVNSRNRTAKVEKIRSSLWERGVFNIDVRVVLNFLYVDLLGRKYDEFYLAPAGAFWSGDLPATILSPEEAKQAWEMGFAEPWFGDPVMLGNALDTIDHNYLERNWDSLPVVRQPLLETLQVR
ncbi:MAG: hypothetical protein SX243_02470 [Acidobacteriota bacterium]|nr:hypothetical protein [Acidobacteriota bacterium]